MTSSHLTIAVEQEQLQALRVLLGTVRAGNRYYAPLLAQAQLDETVPDLATFIARMPLTTKAQLVADQQAHPPYGTNLTYPLSRYTRFHQTSGTTGSPLRWLDDAESWQGLLDNWKQVYAAAQVTAADRIFFAFSFGPFLGFWTAFEAAAQLGCLCLPGGGLSSSARLQMIRANRATVLCCTPTYALHLGAAAQAEGVDLTHSPVRALIVAGEPGGSLPQTRARLAQLWPGARVVDHHGMTEVGPVSFEPPDAPGSLQLIDRSYLAEVLDPHTLTPVAPDQEGELVLTTLRRVGSPLLRYRTGDRVCRADDSARTLLRGGILGRCDDMVVVRGVNVYPSAVDELVRGSAQVAEYQVRVQQRGELTELKLDVEPTDRAADAEAVCRQVQQALRDALGLRVEVAPAAPGTLPRYELKARRWVRD